MHPKHNECLLVYQSLEDWVNQHQITNKQPKYHYEKILDDFTVIWRMNKLLLILLLLPLISIAGGKPCSGKKVGISHFEGTQFVCNDGSISKSAKDWSKYVKSNSAQKAVPIVIPQSIKPTSTQIFQEHGEWCGFSVLSLISKGQISKGATGVLIKDLNRVQSIKASVDRLFTDDMV